MSPSKSTAKKNAAPRSAERSAEDPERMPDGMLKRETVVRQGLNKEKHEIIIERN